jgi:hypothetical protein
LRVVVAQTRYHGDALADADAHGAQRVAAAVSLQLVDRRRHQARAAHAERVAEAMAPPFGFTCGVVVGEAELAQ